MKRKSFPIDYVGLSYFYYVFFLFRFIYIIFCCRKNFPLLLKENNFRFVFFCFFLFLQQNLKLTINEKRNVFFLFFIKYFIRCLFL